MIGVVGAFWATKRKNFQRRGQQAEELPQCRTVKQFFEPLYLERDSLPKLKTHFANYTQCLSEKRLKTTLFSFFKSAFWDSTGTNLKI
jgi:hypothetical protein